MKCIITATGTILLVIQGDGYTVTPNHIRYNEILRVLKDPPVDEELLLQHLYFEEECKAANLEVTPSGQVVVAGRFIPGGAEDLKNGLTPGNIALKAQLKNLEGGGDDTYSMEFSDDPGYPIVGVCQPVLFIPKVIK